MKTYVNVEKHLVGKDGDYTKVNAYVGTDLDAAVDVALTLGREASYIGTYIQVWENGKQTDLLRADGKHLKAL